MNAAVQLPMGVSLLDQGAGFAVWAPHADAVSVVGTFNNWDESQHKLERGEGGLWTTIVEQAEQGHEYKYIVYNGAQRLERNDPYAREVTNSAGNTVVHNPAFDWKVGDFRMDHWNELVIYELHIGTFHRPHPQQVGTFIDVIEKLEYLQWLGINAIEIMPSAEFAGDLSWGYNPAHPFAVESAYGGPVALKQLVDAAHAAGIAVIMDVVYNHFGPSDLDLWQFDGWSENDKGGIYFYNDHRSSTPWGDTRPDYGRAEVRKYIFDNAMMWIDEYRMDGLRYDMTLFMRSIRGDGASDLPDGWSLAQWINGELASRFPHKITIAEDLRSNDAITKPDKWGGANFDSQWDEGFVHPIRHAIITVEDSHRSMPSVRDAILHRYNHDAFERVVYTESHDEVANGKARVPSEISPQDPDSWHARRRSTLGAALTFTVPGIPMIFQGQEFMRRGWFDDARPIDWSRAEQKPGVLRLYRDLALLRRNVDGFTAGLTGQRVEVFHCNDEWKVIAFRRWRDGGRGDDTLVVANFSTNDYTDYRIGAPHQGSWQLRLDTASQFYNATRDDDSLTCPGDVTTDDLPYDGQLHSLVVTIPAYSLAIYSQ
jgi:1,4-alpha-glucan branching enzyme